MRTVIHLSDLHFGRTDSALIAPLIAQIADACPDVVVVSGDLTQRARSVEFIAAQQFLSTLPSPQIVVPGNHDISLHNWVDRFLRPLTKYTRYITSDLAPFYADEEIAVAGVNTARSFTIKNGRINPRQMTELRGKFDQLPEHVVKVVVSHHPFDLPEHFARRNLVKHADTALQNFAQCGADLLLAGHLHASHAGTTGATYPIDGYAALAVQAGTATSTRGRGETNSFNRIRITTNNITVERFSWDANLGDFVLSTSAVFLRESTTDNQRRWRPGAHAQLGVAP